MQEQTPSVDTNHASIARVYDAALGGKDNFEADRAIMREAVAIDPTIPDAAKGNRRWLIRVVGYLADRVGLDQFLDCGSGLPTVLNTHETAQQYRPQARVLYIDNDPTVAAFGRAMLEDNEYTKFLVADLTRPDEVLHAPEAGLLDLGRPLVLMQCGTLHHVPDDQDPWHLMRTYIEAIPSGSYVAITHWHNPHDGSAPAAQAAEMERRSQNSLHSGRLRTREEIGRFFDGLDLLEPGLAGLDEWWPAGPQVRPASTAESLLIGGVGRKP